MMRAVVLALVACAVFAAPGEAAHVQLARQFLAAHTARDASRQALLAARPARRVSYALAVEWLLGQNQTPAAQALAAARGGAEHEGLQRIVKHYLPVTSEQLAALVAAAREVDAGAADDALTTLRGAGTPAPGTLFGARIEWVAGRAHTRAGRRREAAAAFTRCAEMSRKCGWLDRWHRAAAARLKLAANEAAADDLVAAAKALDDPARRRAALRLRAALLTKVARAQKGDAAAKTRRRVRGSLLDAIDIAHKAGAKRDAGLLIRQLAFHWHIEERSLKQAKLFYTRAAETLHEAGDEKSGREVKQNLIAVLRDLAEYDQAIELADELIGATKPESKEHAAAMTQRAYLLARQGRTEKAAAAYDALLDKHATTGLLVEAGELHRLRGASARAAELFRRALKSTPEHLGATVGLARVAAFLGDEAAFVKGFDSALAIAPEAARIRLLTLRAAEERSLGRVEAALATVKRAIDSLEKETRDVGNAAVAWMVYADLLLLRGRVDDALKALANAATLFFRLQDAGRAAPAYAREVLLLVQEGRMEEAAQRLQILGKRIAEPSGTPALRALAKTAEAMYEAHAGRVDAARMLLEAARKEAKEAGRPDLEAAAWVADAIVKPEGLPPVRRALALLHDFATAGPADYPLVVGERADVAASVGLGMLLTLPPDAGSAFELAERIKHDRILIALGGRPRVLAQCGEGAAYAAARGRVLEAEVEKNGVFEARAAFLKWEMEFRDRAPVLAAIALGSVLP
ncbi:MAG: hypothetical protein OER88_00330, partial [Planctomycetota bacterium]|nr:hypothetical protein [Planctomycetota bacterium]